MYQTPKQPHFLGPGPGNRCVVQSKSSYLFEAHLLALSELFYVDMIGFKILNLITKITEYHGKLGKRADITTKYGKKPKNSDPPPQIGVYPLIYVWVMPLVGVVPLGGATHPPTARSTRTGRSDVCSGVN